MRILDHLIRTIRSAANHNTEAQAAPACILWPDPNRQWQSALPALQAAMPELFALGPYAPATRTGPAIWLRGVLSGVLPPGAEPPGWDERNRVSLRNSVSDTAPPVFYLPGYSRQELREVNTSPAALKPLVELQFRGVIWSQVNARDWTILAFLQSARGGLGLDVATDAESRSAMQDALTRLLAEELDTLQGRRLEAIDFNRLIVEDPVRDLLNWIDQEDAFRQQHSPEVWQAFADITRTQYGLDPERASALDGAAALAEHKGAWQQVWARFCEAPQRYTVIPDRIRRCTMPATDLFATATTHEGWPQWNDSQEIALRADLRSLANLPPHSARRRIVELEQQHSDRRRLVWAVLDAAPLARALRPLAELA
ncbi:MAG: BREX-1 system phosphatase PglZ type B, partial [Caldilinea sp.]